MRRLGWFVEVSGRPWEKEYVEKERPGVRQQRVLVSISIRRVAYIILMWSVHCILLKISSIQEAWCYV
jgi:hypothetical protein